MEELLLDKGIIFYTDNRLDKKIRDAVTASILTANLPIVSVSLKPIDFGTNIVVNEKRGYITMIKQITTALENSTAKYVFFCEHDCLYPKSHFDFTPTRDNIFYYNANVWRWLIGCDYAITYDRMISLSGMCVNRKYALAHYKMRMRKINEYGLDKFQSREPSLARKWGYEPGTKKRRRGGLTDDDYQTWMSTKPIIDIRHKCTFSPCKTKLSDFKHQPINWQEKAITDISSWHLEEMFND